ncbi:MaoC/PaaZ C-terminal domain-containing protein [Hoeflea sp. G2-23]|uniref:MaoC/PaaZ C-terminal domain-containing protein n=1 Tax=Hoeflea algicola TaxID=2983763 RepID=A0ABT3ZC80_9HYPH|nr:MaoC/PaaZ C-terminal domain-containing protein [Hoeflea algicola]MCY0149253.1 MaoC/PaaZ C-terminal domain-containing protein [Hoeflea algicola]
MLDYDRLRNLSLPEVRHQYDEKHTILYALSVGLGQDPMDERQLDYVDHRRDLVSMPSMAVVLGYPGLWLAGVGIDLSRVLHGEQDITLHKPLPVSGIVIGATRVTDVIDKGAGKGALIVSEKRICLEETGELLATTRNTSFLKGYGGFGGPSGAGGAPHAPPDTEPDFVVDLGTRPEQALIYRLNGDDNPLHADPESAKQAGFDRPILHGLCSFGVICHALIRVLAKYDNARLKSMKLRFSAPVYPGETIRTEIWQCGSFRSRVVERDVVIATNGLATFGR